MVHQGGRLMGRAKIPDDIRIEGRRRRAREKYAWYIEHGICPQCGQRDVQPGYKRCEPCKARMAAYVAGLSPNIQAERKARLAAYRRTEHGRAVSKANTERMHERRLAAGLCQLCGINPVTGGRKSCEACAEKVRARSRNYREARRNGEPAAHTAGV